MSFLARLGLSLLLFGVVTLVAQHFGYAPRKLANLPPGQLRNAGIAFTVMGGLCLALGGNPRFRRGLLIGLGSLLGLGLIAVVASVLYMHFGRHHAALSPPQPPAWAAPGTAAPRPSAPVAGNPANPNPGPMQALYEKQRLWTSRHGREHTWSIVVHLGPKEPPAGLEKSLQALAGDQTDGGAVVARIGGIVRAALAPLSRPDALRTTLAGLFPGAEIHVIEASRQVVVFVR